MERRAFFAATGAALLAAPLATEGQSKRTPKIGVIFFVDPPVRSPSVDLFWEPMRTFGWVEGQNVVVERRSARGNWKQIQNRAAELVRLQVDVFLVSGEGLAEEIREVTRTIPICVGGGDLQAADMVKNLAKPEGNVTGVQNLEADLAGKRLALLKEAVPRLVQVGVLLWNRSYPTLVALVGAAEDASRPLGLQLQVADGRRFDDLDGAFASLTKAHVRGLLVANSPSIRRQRRHILDLVTKTRLPTIYESRDWVEAGGLMSYGAVFAEIQRRLAECVDKILRGAKPAEVPVQQPTQFELVINLKTAKTLGLTIPPSLLARADQVIE